MDTMKTPLTACLLLAASLAACAGDGPARSAAGGSAQPATVETFDADQKAFMEQGLRQFSRGDPGWEATRARWIAMGPRASGFLVNAMFSALLQAQAIGSPELVQRARHELVLIGAPSVDFMASVLTTGQVTTVYDREQDKDVPVMVDDDMRREAAEVLALIGAPAADATARAADRAETKSGRRFAIQALGNMGERGGPAASSALVRWARDPDWVLRVAAVEALRSFGDDGTRRVLEAALRDGEDLVREKAAAALAGRRETASLPALRQALAEARAAGRLVETRRLEKAVRYVETGR